MKSARSRIINSALDLLVQTNIYRLGKYLFPNVLTVLNYHRIDDPTRSGFDTFKPNISATPANFARQMDYVAQNYHVISCEYLAACLRGEKELPSRAAIITFDDGYFDNLQHAYPILMARNLPAVIFLATNFIGNKLPFYWDFVSYCFFHTSRDEAPLPLTGSCSWTDVASRDLTALRWIETVKKIPELDKQRAVEELHSVLQVAVPDNAFDQLHLSWDQVRDMSHAGYIEFGAHTKSHPILTRISLEQANREIDESKKRIEEAIGKPVISLAYPNGGAADFSDDIVEVVHQSGIEIAFTLLAGPTSYRTVKQDPLTIRRIFLMHTDSFSRFVAKLHGAARLS